MRWRPSETARPAAATGDARGCRLDLRVEAIAYELRLVTDTQRRREQRPHVRLLKLLVVLPLAVVVLALVVLATDLDRHVGHRLITAEL